LVYQNWGDVPLLQVDLYESRPFIGGKVGSFVDRKGNHIEMGLHVFFGCYSNLFRLMKKVGADNNLLVKEHTHTFVNKGGTIGGMFSYPIPMCLTVVGVVVFFYLSC
jgi:zeta-carotene desaturase